jgi:hypothetical protein
VPAVAPLLSFAGSRCDGPYQDPPDRHSRPNKNCPPTARVLIEQARQGLLDAEYATPPVERHVVRQADQFLALAQQSATTALR